MTRQSRSDPRSLPVQALNHVARPCFPASVVAGFAAIVGWYTTAVARSAGDAVAAEVLGYVTTWLGTLSVVLFAFVAIVVLLSVVERRTQEIAARKGWRWT